MEKENVTRVDEIRKRFIRGGLDALSEKDALELLLSYAVSKEDCPVSAQSLLEKYGSLRALLSAPPDRLQRMSGMSNASALLFSLVNQSGRQMFLEDMEGREGAFSDTFSAGRYFMELASSVRRETLYALCVDRQSTFLSCVTVTDGSLLTPTMEARPESVQRIIECALKSSANAVIVCHYQPFGVRTPSTLDDALRQSVRNALGVMKIELLDYFFVTSEDFVSLAEIDKVWESGILRGML